jgi:hypothetical protein
VWVTTGSKYHWARGPGKVIREVDPEPEYPAVRQLSPSRV